MKNAQLNPFLFVNIIETWCIVRNQCYKNPSAVEWSVVSIGSLQVWSSLCHNPLINSVVSFPSMVSSYFTSLPLYIYICIHAHAWYLIVWYDTISIKFYIYYRWFYCFYFTRIVCLMAECLETDRQFHVWDKVPAASFVWNIHIDTYSRILAGKHTHIHKCHKEKNRARI